MTARDRHRASLDLVLRGPDATLLASGETAEGAQMSLNGSLVAMKDVLARHEGKSVKRKAATHQYAALTKAELVELAYKLLNTNQCE